MLLNYLGRFVCTGSREERSPVHSIASYNVWVCVNVSIRRSAQKVDEGLEPGRRSGKSVPPCAGQEEQYINTIRIIYMVE